MLGAADRQTPPIVLFCPASGPRHGIGHVKRCFSLIRESGRGYVPVIWFTGGRPPRELLDEAACLGAEVVECPENAAGADLVVSDMRDTGHRVMDRLLRIAPVVSLDDLGAGGKRAQVTICALPALEPVHANFSGLSYLVPGSAAPASGAAGAGSSPGSGEVVVSFGGSDPHNLADLATRALNRAGVRPVVVTGPLFRGEVRGRCTLVRTPPDPAVLIRGAKLLVTSFGITAYEAMLARTPVALFNHSRYHWRLAGRVPVPNLGYYPRTGLEELSSALGRLLEDPEGLRRSAERNAALIDGKGARRVNGIILAAARGQRRDCLLHHGRWSALRRTEGHTLLRCRRCGDLFLFTLANRSPHRYRSTYFLSEYRKQYGRSYLADRPAIHRMAAARLSVIEGITGRPGRLLDVGCALGFFLEAARERGWEAQGVEVSPYAAAWARKRLGLQVLTGSFLDTALAEMSFDVITLFYVAEHFPRVEEVLERARVLLADGGVLALALPNRGGISYRVSRSAYLDRHPEDHYFDTTPANLKRFLRARGFRCARVITTGIHPERFYARLGIKVGEGPAGRVLQGLYLPLARVLRWGDTFEYYGIKC
ncbi:MAG: methyltransferase domain-containing protein [Spirochaetota bacterium]